MPKKMRGKKSCEFSTFLADSLEKKLSTNHIFWTNRVKQTFWKMAAEAKWLWLYQKFNIAAPTATKASKNYQTTATKYQAIQVYEVACFDGWHILIALRLFLKFLKKKFSKVIFMLWYICHSIQFWMLIPVLYFS